VAFSPDGAQLASASVDQTVRLWDAAGGQELYTLNGHMGAVAGVAFNRDGTRLASASSDQTVKLWDAATGQELRTLKGHTGWVRSVAFSPDSTRLASASDDSSVQLWDTATGQARRTLKGHMYPVMGVAFSPDGAQVASASYDRTVKVWDARPLTPALKAELEARGLADVVCAQAKAQDEALARIRGSKLINAAVRQQALAYVPTYWTGRVQAEAFRLVDALLSKLALKEEVLAAIRADGSLSEAVRQQALELAERSPESLYRRSPEYADHLHAVSRSVVRQPGESMAAYRQALWHAEVVCRLDPQNGAYLNTLGVARYRLGEYREAVETLTRSDQLNAPKHQGSIPADLAFLAMAQLRLGQKEQAQAALARLREAMKNPRWTKDAEAQGFLREAEALLEGKPGEPPP
jgi:hypothetical protein